MHKISTFTDLITHATANHGSKDAFQIRKGAGFRSVNYPTFQNHVFNVAAWLTNNELAGDSKIAVLGENSYAWVVSYLGITVSGATVVPIDKELSAAEIKNLLEQASCKAIFCSEDYLDVFEEMELEIPLFAINTTDDTDFTTIEELIMQGGLLREKNQKFGQGETSAETVSTIVFTSGTTGFSKGVMLTRTNLISNVLNSDNFIKLKGTNLSLLPMNHTYEFTLDILLSIYQGTTIAINNGIKNFAQNLQIFKPTNLLVVPLIAENMAKMVWTKVEAEGKTKKVLLAIKISRFLKSIGIDVRRKLFAPIHEAFGGELTNFFIGGAPLNPVTARQLYDFGFIVNIGYGITECSPLVSGNITDNPTYCGSCGKAIPNTEIKIDNPNENGEGEILVKGEGVMAGYYQNPEATQAVLQEGWFRTGDIGRFDKKGMLFITGRCKNLIVLNNGKNVYPEELETLIQNAQPLVAEVIVYGENGAENQETNICAEIYPDPEAPGAIEEKKSKIIASIETLNETLPYFKRIIDIKFREKEFPKTTTRKIKRY